MTLSTDFPVAASVPVAPPSQDPVSPSPDPSPVPAEPAVAPLLRGSAGLAAAITRSDPWLWQGYLAPAAVTLLTSFWKAGKTTLLSVLLARLKTGGQLAGLPLRQGRALVVSEESPIHWHRRSLQLDFGDHVDWYCQPFKAKPTFDHWSAFIDRLLADHARANYALLAIDPLAAFLPGSENDAGSMLRFLLPLQRLLARQVCILLLHHPARQERQPGQAARGSGALSGSADILIEMGGYPDAPDDDRRRRLHAFSRFPDTPRQLVIEWTADGSDYRSLGTFQEEDFTSHWTLLRAVLADAPRKLKRSEIAKRWPADRPPASTSLARWLEHAVAQGLILKEGRGLHGLPFRYWLPGQEEKWKIPPWQQDLDDFTASLSASPAPPQPPT